MSYNSNTSSPLKILIVEDETFIAQDLQLLLQDWGYEIAGVAANAEDAIDLFNKQLPDLAIVDIHLQNDDDGVQVVQRFNQIQPIPIVYLTAQADAETVLRAKHTTPAAYLLKPFDERHLNISIDLAVSNFVKKSPSTASISSVEHKNEVLASEVKLTSDVILKRDGEIFIKQNYRFVRFSAADITCLEADRNHTYIYTKQQKLVVRIPLATVLERLDLPFLVRVHRSFALNTRLVESFDDSEIIVAGKTVPLSANYHTDFFKNFNVV